MMVLGFMLAQISSVLPYSFILPSNNIYRKQWFMVSRHVLSLAWPFCHHPSAFTPVSYLPSCLCTPCPCPSLLADLTIANSSIQIVCSRNGPCEAQLLHGRCHKGEEGVKSEREQFWPNTFLSTNSRVVVGGPF